MNFVKQCGKRGAVVSVLAKSGLFSQMITLADKGQLASS